MAEASTARWGLSLALVLIAAVCVMGVGGVRAADREMATEPSASRYRTVDDLLLEVNEIVPGFGGVFLANGVPTIHLKDTALKDMAEAAVRNSFGPKLIPPDKKFQVLQGKYSIKELAGVTALPEIGIRYPASSTST